MWILYLDQIGNVGFPGGGKWEKNSWSKARTNNKLNPHYDNGPELSLGLPTCQSCSSASHLTTPNPITPIL